jgi:hypothetical protein
MVLFLCHYKDKYGTLLLTKQELVMQLFRVAEPNTFDEIAEDGMDFHIAIADPDSKTTFIVIGGRVTTPLDDAFVEPNTSYLEQPWLQPVRRHEEREEEFAAWLAELPEAPSFSTERTREFGVPLRIRIPDVRQMGEQTLLAYIVGPLTALPSPPARPSSIYGHLPFGTRTNNSTIFYRWEAFPSSRQITRPAGGGSIARDTYAAPASEAAFAINGFAAVARFALPNLLPACFRWELQPVPSLIECGASVPLYGQSGGGVEVCFRRRTSNRCPIADPVLLPTM